MRPEAIESIVVEVPASSLDVCNIQTPSTGLEGKFSLRATMALGFLGADTSKLDTFTDELMRQPELVAMRDRVTVAATAGTLADRDSGRVRTRDGRELRAVCDVGEPAADLADQGRRLEAKFDALAAPVIGGDRAAELRALVGVDRDAAEPGPLVGAAALERSAALIGAAAARSTSALAQPKTKRPGEPGRFRSNPRSFDRVRAPPSSAWPPWRPGWLGAICEELLQVRLGGGVGARRRQRAAQVVVRDRDVGLGLEQRLERLGRRAPCCRRRSPHRRSWRSPRRRSGALVT